MQQLNRSVLSSLEPRDSVACGVTEDLPLRVVQFGEGNFLRAFVDWMVDQLNELTSFNGSVAVVQPIPSGRIDELNAQDGLYTLILRGIEDGKPCDRRRIITSIRQGLNPYANWRDFLKLATAPELRFMVSNTTEAGIAYQATDSSTNCPASFPAKVTYFLYERFKAFRGAQDKGLIMLPCELINRNGDALKKCVLQHASDWSLESEFANWLEDANLFLNTLVDRIVTGFPASESEAIFTQLGYRDHLLDTGEPFHLWVIEGPPQVAEELPLAKIGLNVVWTEDLQPFRTRKVRVLNGAHTSTVLAASLAGLETVDQMMADEDFGHLVRNNVMHEVLEILPGNRDQQRDYAQAVLDRFKNPHLGHQLLDISLNSVSKWKVRVLPSVQDFHQKFDRLPPGLTLSLAALLRFYCVKSFDGDQAIGEIDGRHYPIRDNKDVIVRFHQAWTESGHDVANLVRRILGDEQLWDVDLNALPGLHESVTLDLKQSTEHGFRGLVQRLHAS